MRAALVANAVKPLDPVRDGVPSAVRAKWIAIRIGA
jgi:hypothetical protein